MDTENTNDAAAMPPASAGSIVGPSWHPIRDAWATLSERMREDRGFAWSVHCNLAMPFQDEGGSREASNRAAARIMDAFFGVDVTGFAEWDFADSGGSAEAANGRRRRKMMQTRVDLERWLFALMIVIPWAFVFHAVYVYFSR